MAAYDAYTRTFAIHVYDDGTNSYNCHGYAWNVSAGGNEVWINNLYTESGNLDNYWDDGSYIELNGQPSSTANVKVFYGSNNSPDYDDDHSAVTTTNSSVFISKMGCGVRCSHLKTNSPYDESDLKYFTNFQVNGPQLVCSGNTATFTTPDYVNCTFTWTYNTSLLDIVSGQGTNTFIVEPKTSYSQGEAWVKLTLVIDLDDDVTRTVTKNVWVGAPDPDDFTVYIEELYGNPVSGSSDGPFEVCDYNSYWICLYPFFLFDDQGINDVDFDFNFDYDVLDEGDDYIVITTHNIYEESTGEIYVNSDCGYYTLKFLDFVEGTCGYYLMITPNPSSTETTLSIGSNSTEEVFDETAEWEMEIYSPTQTLTEKKTKLKGKSTTIQTQSWKEGVYVVRVKYKDEILTGKLVVKK